MNGVLAFDLGTSGVKASIYAENGTCLASKIITYPLYSDADGLRREQEPMAWWNGICEASSALMKDRAVEIRCIGVSGHSLGIVPVDPEGRLLLNRVPIWSDARAGKEADAFFEKESQESWYLATGCGFAPGLYPIFKLRWLRDHDPETYRKARFFLGTKDFVNLCMTGVSCTDRSYASGTGMYELSAHAYINRYAELAGIDGEKLPPLAASSQIIGFLRKDAAEKMGLIPGIPVIAGGVDNACMCLGAGCYSSGRSYASMGTSAWVALAADDPCLDYEKRIYTFEHCVDGLYVPAAGIYSSGSSLNWAAAALFADLQNPPWVQLTEIAQASPIGSNGVIFCPVLAGGSYVDPSTDMMGGFYHLTLGTSRSDLARSVFEGISCELALAFDSLDSHIPIREPLLLAGGGARNDMWCQMYADVFGHPVYRTGVMQNAASLGVAALCWKALGEWKDYSPIEQAHAQKELFEPNEAAAASYTAVRRRFWRACTMQAQLDRKEEE